MIVGVRYSCPGHGAWEFTYFERCVGTPEEWAAAHVRQSRADNIIERFESEVPVNRRILPDGTVIEGAKVAE